MNRNNRRKFLCLKSLFCNAGKYIGTGFDKLIKNKDFYFVYITP